jgi:hypothetical protein
MLGQKLGEQRRVVTGVAPEDGYGELRVGHLIEANGGGRARFRGKKKECGSILEASFREEGIRILESRRLPSCVIEIVGQEAGCGRLFSIPARHPPQALENVLFLQGKVVETAVNRILFIALGVFVSGDDLYLGFLPGVSAELDLLGVLRTRALMSVIHMKMPLSRACSHNIFP